MVVTECSFADPGCFATFHSLLQDLNSRLRSAGECAQLIVSGSSTRQRITRRVTGHVARMEITYRTEQPTTRPGTQTLLNLSAQGEFRWLVNT